MPTFMIVPTEDAQRLAESVTTAFANEKDRYILEARQACFVKFDGTSEEIAQKLDLAGNRNADARPCPAVITLVTTYGGFGPTSFWEWLSAPEQNGRLPERHFA